MNVSLQYNLGVDIIAEADGQTICGSSGVEEHGCRYPQR